MEQANKTSAPSKVLQTKEQKTKLEVSIKHNKDGLRYGFIELDGLKETLPKQIITTTDLNRLNKLKVNVNLKSKLLELLDFTDLNKMFDSQELMNNIDNQSSFQNFY